MQEGSYAKDDIFFFQEIAYHVVMISGGDSTTAVGFKDYSCIMLTFNPNASAKLSS